MLMAAPGMCIFSMRSVIIGSRSVSKSPAVCANVGERLRNARTAISVSTFRTCLVILIVCDAYPLTRVYSFLEPLDHHVVVTGRRLSGGLKTKLAHSGQL